MTLVQLFGPDPGQLRPFGIRYGQVVYAADIGGASMDDALDTAAALLDEAGVSGDGLARVTAFVRTPAEREPVYGPWDTLFPDPGNRPAFKVLLADLPDAVNVSLNLLALADGHRVRLDIPGVPARDPTVRVGNWILTSRVHGTDPATGEVAAGGLDSEARQAFDNIAALTTTSPVTNLQGFVRDADAADALRRAHTTSVPLIVHTNFVPPAMHGMLEAIAGRPAISEIFSDAGRGPMPDAICIDDLLYAPALKPTQGADFEAQLRSALASMDAVLNAGGFSAADVAHVTVFFPTVDLKPILNQVWSERFPDAADRPPHKYVPIDLSASRQVELQVFAVKGARRQVMEIPGLVHGDPMSMGARLGNLLFSSRIVGTDTASGETPADPESQARIALDNVRTMLAAAGATPDDVSQILAFIITDRDRAAIEAALPSIVSTDSERSHRPRVRFLTASLPGMTTVRLEIIAAVPSNNQH